MSEKELTLFVLWGWLETKRVLFEIRSKGARV